MTKRNIRRRRIESIKSILVIEIEFFFFSFKFFFNSNKENILELNVFGSKFLKLTLIPIKK